jgi:hypothetical protein
MRWEGLVACMGCMRNAYKILVGKAVERRQSGDIECYRRIILEWVWRNRMRICGLDISGSG